ncbi:hypothetical protein HN799_05375, partial [Candidatus Woesearchaeota archaeon]|nr:hypothetical protein [Candidatus Woesearchaeota archaeon]
VELIDNQVRATITNENLILDANGTGVVSVSSNFEVAGDNFRVVTPQTPAGVGVSGDLPGMFAYDSAYIYICTGVYDGSTAIWRRSLMASF